MEPISVKKSAWIVDIDGTVAEMNGRSPYDWGKVGTDKPREAVINFIRKNCNDELIFLSGRDSICAKETLAWLKKYFPETEFMVFMRPERDNRKDVIVKEELFTKHIEPYYNVEVIIDDRRQVCRMWHRKGLPLMMVGDPDADF